MMEAQTQTAAAPVLATSARVASPRRALTNFLINAGLLLLPFLFLELVFRLLPVSNLPYLLPVTAEQPVPRFQADVEYRYSRDWNFSVVARRRTNNFGYSHAADYHPAETTPLLMVIGDSFVEGHVVDAGKTAAELLHARLAGSGRVYSIGISGAALAQYLVFAEHARDTFRPNAMAFFIIGNDFDESLLKYKSEPRFHYFDDSGNLKRIDYELPRWKKALRHSALVRYLALNIEPTHKLMAIRKRLLGKEDADDAAYVGAALEQRIVDSNRAVDHFLDQLPAKSGLAPESIVLVLDALRPAIYSPAALTQASNQYDARMMRYLAQQARARGYQVQDMQPVFIDRHRKDRSRFEAAPTDSHWNELGHRVVAGEMEKSALYARLFTPRP